MHRPISFKENEINFTLMRNRRQEICEIPVEYVTTIDYDINTYATMTLEIPSKITYKGQSFDYFLYDEIKGN